MILFDGIHLASDVSLEELYEYAERIGLKKYYLHNGKIPHFDLFGKIASKVIKNCTSKELVLKCKDIYRKE